MPPEPVPTTNTGATAKKLPKWLPFAVIGGGAALYLYYKKKKTEEEEKTTAYTNQSFIPVTGENVAGAGVGGGYSAPIGGESGNTALLGLFQRNQEATEKRLERREETEQSRSLNQENFQDKLIESILGKTGGGPPGNGQIGTGSGSGGGGEGPTRTTTPENPVVVKQEKPEVVHSEPQKPTGPAYQTITCPNGCEGHYYPSEHRTECQVKCPGPVNTGHPKGLYCKWPPC